MKKFKIFCYTSLIFFFHSLSYASCYTDLEWSWSLNTASANFEFLNNKNKKIKITNVSLLTADKDVVVSNNNVAFIDSYGRRNLTIFLINKNTKVIKSATYTCEYNPL